MGIPEEEAAKVRAEVMEEMKAEESGEVPAVDVSPLPKEEVNPWEGVNPALKQAFDNMSQTVTTLQASEMRLKQAESRIGSITNELHAAKKAAETVKAAPSAEQMEAAAVSDENWENLKNDFPEWANAFDGRFDKKLSTKIQELKDEIKTEMGGSKISPDLDLRLLNIVKPKWKDTVKTKEWKEWLAVQTPELSALVASERAEDAITLINSYEESSMPQKTATEIAAERKQRMKTAVLPQGGKAVPVKSEADMSASELRANIGKEIFAE